MKSTRDFGKVIAFMMASDKNLAQDIEDNIFDATIAMQVYDARMEAKLTQAELAKKLHTTQSVISRIEDADYDAHSLKLLKRIAAALDLKLSVEFRKKQVLHTESTTQTVRSHTNWPNSPEWHLTYRE